MTDRRESGPVDALEELRGEFLRVARKQHPSAPRGLVRPLLVVTAVSLFGLGAAAGIFTRSGERAPAPFVGPATEFSARGTYYASMGQLIRRTDLVIAGTVQEVTPGRTIDEDPDEPQDTEFPTRYVNTIVSVDEIFKGKISRTSDAVVVETLELAFSGEREWRTAGQRVVLFLSPSVVTPEAYVLSSDQGGPDYEQTAYMLMEEDVIPTTHDEIAREVASLSLPQLRQRVRSGP